VQEPAAKENPMKRPPFRFHFLLLVALAASCDVYARQIEDWSYDRLFTESDLIVIAQPVQSEDSADRTKDNLWKIEFNGVETKFDVLHTVKGTSEKSTLTVLHYRTDALIEDGPSLASFRTKGSSYTILKKQKEGDAGKLEEITQVFMEAPATYLLFLKKRDDGRFEPVSGRNDPVFSVRELRMPARLDYEDNGQEPAAANRPPAPSRKRGG